ncbi:21002_t:CDS:2, partial [Cetraspora pellucida]
STSEDEISFTISTIFKTLKTNLPKRQTSVNKYITCSLSKKNKLHFENLILYIIISNGLPFTFIENYEMQKLAKDILQHASEDKIEVTAAFNSWTNIKQEHLFDIKLLIKDIMNSVKEKNIIINCYVSNSANKYAAASSKDRMKKDKTQEYRAQEDRAQEDKAQEDRAQKEITEYFLCIMNNINDKELGNNEITNKELEFELGRCITYFADDSSAK